MKITLSQASDILNRTPDEIMFIANTEKRLSINIEDDNDIEYRDDGTVTFKEGNSTQEWWLDFDEVISLKKEMEDNLVGEVEGNLS